MKRENETRKKLSRNRFETEEDRFQSGKEIVEGVLEANALPFHLPFRNSSAENKGSHYAGENFVPGRNMWSEGTGASTLPV